MGTMFSFASKTVSSEKTAMQLRFYVSSRSRFCAPKRRISTVALTRG
jgi:hypothetical protein